MLRLAVFPDVGDMQEGSALEADLDERALHAGQHAGNAAKINVADQAAMTGTLDVQLVDHTVIEHCHARLLRRDVDENFLSHGLIPTQISVAFVIAAVAALTKSPETYCTLHAVRRREWRRPDAAIRTA